MELTDKQAAINEDPRYWEWFEKWWAKDFSWEGLKNKKSFSGIPLQEYYASENDARNMVEAFGKKWRIVNLPHHDVDGNPLDIGISVSVLKSNLRNFLNENDLDEIHGCVFPKHSILSNRAMRCSFSRTSSVMNTDIGRSKDQLALVEAEDSYVEETTLSPVRLVRCTIKCDSISAPENGDGAIRIRNCRFPRKISLQGPSIYLHNNLKTEGIKLRAQKIETDNLKCERLSIQAFRGQTAFDPNETPYIFDYNISLSPTTNTQVSIYGSRNAIRDTKLGRENLIRINSSEKHMISIEHLIDLLFELEGRNIGDVFISNCQFSRAFQMSPEKIESFKIDSSIFNEGFVASNLTAKNKCALLGCKIQGNCEIKSSKFENGFSISSLEQSDGEDLQSTINSADFSNSKFFFDGPNSNSSKHICAANFSNTKFQYDFTFDDVTLFGFADFTDATLPSNASFNDLKLPQFLPSDSDPYDGVIANEQYSTYQTSFRILRQFMEKSKNFTEVHKFGRLEAIAKQRRGITEDVTKWEYRLTKWYGKFADYGQSIERPLKWLLRLLGLSFVFQYLVFWLFNRPCLNISSNCSFSLDGLTTVIERASTFALPPFSALAKRSAPSKEAEQNSKVLESAFSEGLMLLHGILATILIFLLLLAVKRRLQFK